MRNLHHPNWTAVKIGGLQGKFVRLTGWVMFDSGHSHHSHKGIDLDQAGIPLKRATKWDVHPVTKVEVWTSTVTKCKQGTGWKDVN